MRYLWLVLFFVVGSVGAMAQDEDPFLNRSICPSPDMSLDEEYNEYVQGSGHNYYQSYPAWAHFESYSEQRFPIGSEQNPMVIYEDSSRVTGRTYTYKYQENGVNIPDQEGTYWYTDPDQLALPSEGPTIVDPEARVFQCINEKEEF